MNRQRLAELFDQAVELPIDARAEWLATACGDDAALRAELEKLLHADAHDAHFMERPPALVAGAATAARTESPPRQFGPYRVLRAIGVGGMGEVWLAERSDGEFEQRVAIKQLAYPTPGLLQRFRQERQILARLEHPHIARLIDGGVAADATPYLVMEFIEGVPITDYARDHALDVPARLKLFLHVCEAVQYAHQNLIVHRDLKPSNIFVTLEGLPKLLDFGIAKVLSTTDAGAPTQTIARMCTPDYAAPEQFNGGPITTATDVYALGVVLYELLAGSRPQRAPHLGATDGATVSMLDPPMPPSAALGRAGADVNTRRRVLRGDLDRIVLTALAPDVRRRYPSAEALAADIRSYLDGRPIAARGDNRLYRLRRFAGRNRFALTAAAFAFAICVAATIVSLQQARMAREQAARAERQVARADAVHRFLVGVFEQASPDASRGKPISVHELLDRSEPQIGKELAKQPALRVDVTTLLGNLYNDIGDLARARTLLGRAVQESANPLVPAEARARSLTALALLENDGRESDAAFGHATQALQFATAAGAAGLREASAATHAINTILVSRGDSRAAEPRLRETLATDRAAFGESSEAVAQDWQLLGTALDELTRYEESAAAFRKAIGISRTLHGDRSEAVARGSNDLGLMLLHKGDLDGAERALRETVDICSELYGANTDGTWTARSNYLRVLELQGRFSEALAQRLEIFEAEQSHVDQSRPAALAYASNFIGSDQRELGQLAAAEASFRHSLALWKAINGSDDQPSSAAATGNLGITLMLQGRYAEAETALRAAYGIESRHGSPTSQWVNLARGDLGNLIRLQHRYAEALQELDAAAAAVTRPGSDANPWIAQLMAQLGEAALDAGNPARAQEAASSALANVRKSVRPGSPRLAAPLFAMARVHLASGNPREAEALLREALAIRSALLPATDPRVLELKAALANASAAQGRTDEAKAMAKDVRLALKTSASPYAADLRARIASL